jgi:hypothetical protein
VKIFTSPNQLNITDAARGDIAQCARYNPAFYRAKLTPHTGRPSAQDFLTVGRRLTAVCTQVWGETRTDLYWGSRGAEDMIPDNEAAFTARFNGAEKVELRLHPNSPAPVFTYAFATLELKNGHLCIYAQQGGEEPPKVIGERLVPHIKVLFVDDVFMKRYFVSYDT